MSYADAQLLAAYYRGFSQHWVDPRPIQACLTQAEQVLWLGSYFGLAKPAPRAHWVILDLDAEMLKIGAAHLPQAMAVQGDIRLLPFEPRFDSILCVGCVTAYLLDDADLAAAAASISRALRRHRRSRLLIDAYLADSILQTDYFQGERLVRLNGQGWWRQAWVTALGERLFDVRLNLASPTGQRHRLDFRQRAFTPAELSAPFIEQGLQLLECRRDNRRGRFSLSFAPAARAFSEKAGLPK